MSRPKEAAQETITRLEGALRRQGETNEAQRLRIKELEEMRDTELMGQELVRLIREIAK